MSGPEETAGMRECTILTAAFLILATPRLLAGSTTPFRLGSQGGVIVSVTLEGKGPFLMLLDTGATHSAITERVREIVGAKTVAMSNVIAPTRTTIRPVVAVEHWSFGPVTVDVVLPTVVADGSFDREAPIEGLIGQDVLAGLRYTIDFKRRLIEWHDAAPTPGGISLHLAFERGRFLIALPHQQSMVRLVPDSGAGAIILFELAGRMPLEVLETGQTVELTTADATVEGRRVKIRELRLGGQTIRNVAAVAIRRDEVDPSEGDGLLPLHLFECVTFDGPGRRMILGRKRG
jgi:predicted aspartyl protease